MIWKLCVLHRGYCRIGNAVDGYGRAARSMSIRIESS